MSAGYLRRCAGKLRLESKDEANKKRAALRAAKVLGKGALDVYRCDQCLGWHVGRSDNAFITRRRTGKRPNKRMRGRV